ncbi:leucine rich repeat and fibronectin type III domain containing 2-like protein [Clostridium sp. CAG:451]|nr:leucine rich repeat and fibronectin type III domain containing 2-like protein [Clostridium sp. CAG:451]
MIIMNNKVLVKVSFIELDEDFDMFLPVNELIWKLKKLMLKSISDLTRNNLDKEADYILINKKNSKIYDNNQILLDTDIRNGTELLLIKN